VAGDASVGPYRILRLINRGGQGSVYLGYDERLRRRVAVKIYPLAPEREARKRQLLEAQWVASIQSPKVVQIHDVIESSEHLAMVMEYVPGCDLQEFLAAVRPSLPSILTIAADIAGALTVARQQHIVHGDLKAANVLIAETGRVKLTDFGISRGPAGSAGTGLAAGSLSAVSPEQYLGNPVDARSDLFALGCLLYRMLTGVQPFFRGGQLDGRSLLESMPQPVEQLVPADVELPRELVDLVAALLQKDPGDRPGNTRIVRQALRRAARELPLAATNSLLEEARPCFRRESAEDLPPTVPPDLATQGRSRLARAQPFATSGWRKIGLASWRSRTVATLALAVLVAISLAISQQPTRTRVHIEAPTLRLDTEAALPEEISGRWLVEQVALAAGEQVGPMQLTGPPGIPLAPTALSARPEQPQLAPVQEQLQFGLRCIDLMCVFAVTRNWDGQRANQQAVLFPDMPAEQWRDIVRSTTRALYP
jgi:eukaryotic-like serine/threonine-protein kinase